MTRLRVLVTGSKGQLAQAIRETWREHDLIMPDESVLDLGQRESILEACRDQKPNVVINAGAFTQVDRCESEPERAHLINGLAVGWLAEGCEKHGALLVQISTDYVFDGLGSRPYREDDRTGPLSVYGQSKLQGEQEAARAPEHLIVRTAWLYDSWGKNFYLTMRQAAAQGRKLRVVNDQRGTPTTCRALARPSCPPAPPTGWYTRSMAAIRPTRPPSCASSCTFSRPLSPATRTWSRQN